MRPTLPATSAVPAASAAGPERLRRRTTLLLVLGLMVVALVTLVTHLGSHSPYTWGHAVFGHDRRGSQIDGLHVNPDASELRIVELTEGFYQFCGIDVGSANVHMPLHAFCVAVILGVTRSFMLASLITNLLALLLLVYAFTRTCVDFDVPPGATLLAGVICLLLPWVGHYVGQPLNYTFSICLNMVIALATARLAQRGERSPWVFGVLVAVLVLNYDWFVFAGAIGVFLLFAHPFERRVDYLKLAATAAIPMLLWGRLVKWASAGATINELRNDQFFVPVEDGWRAMLRAPLANVLEPFVLSHVGVGMAIRQVLGQIYWPLAAVALFLVVKLRPDLRRHRWGWLPVLLVVVYVAEQMGTAAFDWENNPRRAIPVVFAAGVALAYVIAQTYGSKGWRAAFIALAVGSFGLSFSDRLLANPVIPELQSGEAARDEPKWPMKIYQKRLSVETMPLLPIDGPLQVGHFQAKCAARGNGAISPGRLVAQFALAQVLLGGILVGFFAVMRRLEWLPRDAATGLAALYGLSLIVRFVWR